MQNLNICFISREYPPLTHTGGIGTYTHVAARGLADRGHRVHVICVTTGEEQTKTEDGVIVHRIPVHPFLLRSGRLWYPVRVATRKIMFQFLEHQAWSYGASLALEEIRKKEPIRIVEYAETNAEGYYASLIPDIKKVCRLHIGGFMESSSNMHRNIISLKKTNYIEKKSILSAHRITCPSKALADLTAKYQNVDRNIISVFPNPLDSEFVNCTVREKESFDYRLLFLGRIERRKGIEILLSAFINVLSRYPQTRLRLVGQDYGYYYDPVRKVDRLRELLTKYNVKKNVEFLPRQSRSDLISQFDWADAVVVPSINENFPYVVLEAMSQAKPVIASDCGGIPEIITNMHTGFLFPTGDISGLTESICQALETPSFSKRIGLAAMEHVRTSYSIQTVIPEIEKAYQEALLS